MINSLYLILLCLNALISISFTERIIQLDAQSFIKAKNQYKNLVVMFESHDCQFCKQMKKAFMVAALKMSQTQKYQDVQFARLAYQSPKVAKIFAQHHIDAVPQIRILVNGIDSKAKYLFLNYKQLAVNQLITWIDRITNLDHIKQIQDEQSSWNQCSNEVCNLIIVKCSDRQMIKTLMNTKIYRQTLDVTIKCTNNPQNSPKNEGLIFKNSLTSKLANNCIQESVNGKIFRNQCENFIYNMRHHQIQQWNHNHISQMFQDNRTIFAALVGNQSRSRQYLKQYISIKDKWNKNKNFQLQKLPIFVVVDKDYQRQEFLKLKKFIGGYQSDGLEYPLPLIAALKVDDNRQLQKIHYQTRFPVFKKSSISLEQWMFGVMSEQIKTPYFRNRQFKITAQQDTSDHIDSVIDTIIASKQDKRLYQCELNVLLKWFQMIQNSQRYPEQTKDEIVFVLYYCKTHYEMIKFVNQVKKWYKQQSQTYVQIIMIDYIQNDFPPGSMIETMPALLKYEGTKLIQKKQGILNANQFEKALKGAEKTIKNKKQ